MVVGGVVEVLFREGTGVEAKEENVGTVLLSSEAWGWPSLV